MFHKKRSVTMWINTQRTLDCFIFICRLKLRVWLKTLLNSDDKMNPLNAYQKVRYNHTLHLLCLLLNTASWVTVLMQDSCHPNKWRVAGIIYHQPSPRAPAAGFVRVTWSNNRMCGLVCFPLIKCKLRAPWSTLVCRNALCARLPASTHPCPSSFTVKGRGLYLLW